MNNAYSSTHRNSLFARISTGFAAAALIATVGVAGCGEPEEDTGDEVAIESPLTTTGKTFYISPSGNDSNSGSLSSPFKTMARAASKMAPGDLALLRGGTYDAIQSVKYSGTSAAPLKFGAYPGEAPLLTNTRVSEDTLLVYGSYVTIDGLRVTSGVDSRKGANIIAGAHNVTLQNCEIFGTKGQGLMLSGDNNLIYANRIHDNGSHAKYDHGIYVQGKNNVIRANSIYNNWANGIQLYNGYGTINGGTVVEYNYIYHNGYGATSLGYKYNAGVIVADGNPNSIIRNNRICNNKQYGVYMISKQTGTKITDNVFCYSDVSGFNPEGAGSGTVATGNIYFNDTGVSEASYSGVSTSYQTFYNSGRAPTLQWNYSNMSLATFQSKSGQDKGSVIANPGFTNVPTSGFDATRASTYNFCNKLKPAFCTTP